MSEISTTKLNYAWLIQWQKKMITPLSSEKYSLVKRANILVATGSIIAMAENLISILCGFHNTPIDKAIVISLAIIFFNVLIASIHFIKKDLRVWHEYSFFVLYLVLFLIAFSVWEYRLGGMRFLALINALTTVTILLSYINILQSLIIALGVLVSYYTVAEYSIVTAGQPGSIVAEIFLSLCLLPVFLLISTVAWFMNRKRNEIVHIRNDLQRLNDELRIKHEELKLDREYTEIELDLAGEIQRVLFPVTKPDLRNWDIAFMSEPADEVSGDFYDFYTSERELNGLSLFDVSGHGVAPALITIYAKPLIFRHFKRCLESGFGEVLESVNRDLSRQLSVVDLYVTGIMLRTNGDKVEYINAGHPDLIYFDSNSGNVKEIDDRISGSKGEPLGVSAPEKKYTTFEIDTAPGDVFVLYSNGLLKRRNEHGEPYSKERLRSVVLKSERGSAVWLVEKIKKDIDDFCGETRAIDDVTIIVALKV